MIISTEVESDSLPLTSVMEPVLSVRNLHKTYEMEGARVLALRGVSLDICAGEFVAIMGASGSGKSTFMNVLGLLDDPTSGTYRFEGTDVSELSLREVAQFRNRRIGFVFQGFNLLSRTSALENVELPMLYAHVPKQRRHERALEVLTRVGLANRTGHFPSQLSGGQQQRVAIARALVNEPTLILADEPTGNLDSYSSVDIMGIFQKLNEQGMTIILVTHEHDIAQYATRQIVFRDGRILSDTPVIDRLIASEVLKTLPRIEES